MLGTSFGNSWQSHVVWVPMSCLGLGNPTSCGLPMPAWPIVTLRMHVHVCALLALRKFSEPRIATHSPAMPRPSPPV